MSGQALRSPCAARVGGRPLARAAARAALVLTVLLGVPLAAQAPQWEALPDVWDYPQRVSALGFLEGDTPETDSLVAFFENGVFLYNPSGAAGAAGANGPYHPWHLLCQEARCQPGDGVVTAAGTLVGYANFLQRSTDRGRTWVQNDAYLGLGPVFESSLPALRAPDGTPMLFFGTGDGGQSVRSWGDAAPGTFQSAGTGYDYPVVFGEVPPSAALPEGRILYGVLSGALYSDDGGMTYTPSSAWGQTGYRVNSFAFLPDPAHLYGGVTYAGVENASLFPAPRAEVLRSDDGGVSYTLAHRFTPKETDLPGNQGRNIGAVELLATPDGALWAGVNYPQTGPSPWPGRIMRSTDGGATWSRADAGFDGGQGHGYRVHQLSLARDGRLYAATDRGVWRTTGPAVAASARPSAGGLAVAVAPNPASASVRLLVTAPEAGTASVSVVDAQGRAVAAVYEGPLAAGATPFVVDTSGWAAGVYVVRASVGERTTTARVVVTR